MGEQARPDRAARFSGGAPALATRTTADLARLEAFVAAQGGELLDWRYKGFGSLPASPTVQQVRDHGLRLFDLGTPMMTIDESAVADNLMAMSDWCAASGVRLAPHGKTTMAPLLWLGQLLAGCTAITVANATELRAARAFGVSSIHLANELVRPGDVAWVAKEMASDPDFDFMAWVDSTAAVRLMDAAVPTGAPPVPVCVEVGARGGRTGVRTVAAALEVAASVREATHLRLAGVSGYEGAVPGAGTDADGLRAVDEFLRLMVAVYESLHGRYEIARPTITAGGSAYFDRVAAVLGPLARSASAPVDVLLRSGAYVVHDDLHYSRVTPSTRSAGPTLRSAIHVWATVLSRPEADLAILDAGRRDLPFDLGLPLVLAASRGAGGEKVAIGPASMRGLNDQHGFVRLEGSSNLGVGDVVKLGLSHPCTAFDKWRAIPLVASAADPNPWVTDVALTYF